MRKFEVMCPKCGNKQIIEIRSFYPQRHYKQCVFCGYRFCIHRNARKTAIVREIANV